MQEGRQETKAVTQRHRGRQTTWAAAPDRTGSRPAAACQASKSDGRRASGVHSQLGRSLCGRYVPRSGRSLIQVTYGTQVVHSKREDGNLSPAVCTAVICAGRWSFRGQQHPFWGSFCWDWSQSWRCRALRGPRSWPRAGHSRAAVETGKLTSFPVSGTRVVQGGPGRPLAGQGSTSHTSSAGPAPDDHMQQPLAVQVVCEVCRRK